ncbi:hypothetical protein [Mycolicibacterium sp. P9-64]|uniref:hypothetical protein n=1 Tax=Mycolicibacterium sp. P9-64 TaxID=2024612 RepID=UPI001F5BBAEE|nr:hypothetical protein [Mycolicibacterium sp. P9-64]
MSNQRRARKVKQARRFERRAKTRNERRSADWTLGDALRRALAGHPLSLLTMASMVINVAKSEQLRSLKSDQRDTSDLDRVLTGLIGVQNRETAGLLAVVAELLVDDPAPALRCREEVAERGDHLPRWIAALPKVDVYRAVRRTHVFGDVDEILIGMRLHGGHELTIGVRIDHNLWSSVVDAGALPDPIGETLARLAETSKDTSIFEMALADSRAWIEDALNMPALAPKTGTWPLYKALVQWLVGRLPAGGERRSPPGDPEVNEELCEGFFATSSAAPFTEVIGSSCWSSSMRGRATHCDGARRVPSKRWAARPTTTPKFRWKSRWTLPICYARSFHTLTRRVGFETN